MAVTAGQLIDKILRGRMADLPDIERPEALVATDREDAGQIVDQRLLALATLQPVLVVCNHALRKPVERVIDLRLANRCTERQ